jgi:DNA-binding SARP family transcriptional activator
MGISVQPARASIRDAVRAPKRCAAPGRMSAIVLVIWSFEGSAGVRRINIRQSLCAESGRGNGVGVSEGWRFGLLGPLQVECDGVTVPIKSAKQRVVLAALALAGGKPVTVDRLIKCLWDDQPPSSARNTVQNFVLRLRRALQAGGPCPLVSASAGYRLEVDAEAVDLYGFESLQRNARSQAAAGDVRSADRLIDEALGMWRGEPLADVVSEALHREVVPGLVEAHLTAREERLDLDLRLGRHQEAVARLTEQTTRYPLRERGWAQLMLALYRCGRTAEALAAYQKASKVLAEELGVDPGPELRRLFQAMLTDDPQLALADPVLAAGSEPTPGKRAPSVVPRQLPTVTGHFVGRASELDKLSTRLAAATDSALTAFSVIGGTAGIGKSKLAVHWGHLHADRFPDGQLYVNLRGFDPAGVPLSPKDAVRGFLSALGVPPSHIPVDPDERYALYRSQLAGCRMLVVLDNARDAEQVRPLLPGAPGPVVLVTSRDQLGGLVALDGALPLNLDPLTEGEARDLLVHRLGWYQVEWEPAEVDALITWCAGLPVALVILAARAALNPDRALAELVDERRDPLRRLDGLSVGEGAADLRTVFSWSYHALSAEAARVFRLLGLHRGPDIDLSAVASLTALERAQAHSALAELTRVRLVAERAAGCYSLHDLLRAYAVDLAVTHDTAADRGNALRRLDDHYRPTRGAHTITP